MHFAVRALQQNPELAVFLTLAVGFLIGRSSLGSFSLGIVVGTLLAGVLIGQLDIKVPGVVKTIFFDLFLFTTGYKVGPAIFFAGSNATLSLKWLSRLSSAYRAFSPPSDLQASRL